MHIYSLLQFNHLMSFIIICVMKNYIFTLLVSVHFFVNYKELRNHSYSLGIIKILLVRGKVISWVTGLLHYNARQFITLLNVHGDINSWVGVTHKIHEHCPLPPTNKDDSRVFHFWKSVEERVLDVWISCQSILPYMIVFFLFVHIL